MNKKSTLTKVKNKLSAGAALLGLALLGTGALQAQVTYSFTTGGATGPTGPSQGQINTAYQLTNLNGSVICNGGIQSFTIPATGPYKITAAGAGGGDAGSNGGRGRIVEGEIVLTQGAVIRILVGQKGMTGGISSGGGGGTYVVDALNNPIIIGGGGGGFSDPSGVNSPEPNSDASYTQNGEDTNDGSGFGGTNGDGGQGSNYGYGGGGGGFNTDGSSGVWCGIGGGESFLNGGEGGNTCYVMMGGFGGGGGTHGYGGGGGGGGGYSGGGGSAEQIWNAVGGGGGSYQSMAMVNLNDGGLNTGPGYVTIEKLYSVGITQSGTIACFGQTTATLTAQGNGGTPPYTYTWAPGGATTTVISNLGAGIYTCTITDQSGQIVSSTHTVTQPPLLAGTINNVNNVACKGGLDGSAHVATTGGVGPYQYAWTPNGGYASTAFGLSANTYTVYVLDQNACQINRTVTITEPPTSVGVIATGLSVCPAASVVLTGTGATTYTWTGGISNGILFTPTITSTYTVTGTNTLTGCTHSLAVTVTVLARPELDVAGSTSVCPGQIITLGVSGAETYTWQPGNLTGYYVNVSPTVSTVYSVTGRSAEGCYSQGAATLAVGMTTCVSVEENQNELTSLLVYPNPTTGEFTVELDNGQTKTAEVLDVTGRLVMTATTENKKLSMNINGLSNGVYYLKIQSENASKIVKLVKH